MADAAASKAVEGNLMGVQVPSPAPKFKILPNPFSFTKSPLGHLFLQNLSLTATK